MLGLTISLPKEDKDIVIRSLEKFKETLASGEKKIYELAISVVDKGGILDGMYMRCIERALQHAAFMTNNDQEKVKYQDLATFYQKKREFFQFSTFYSIRLAAGVTV
ncbi:hypothetical protein [Thermaerobacillus caldiproteolyticus]|uniref:hypothetical protein n=1 Tax=Thermaerobacillus caldiproteolyticus TaxID=247480 RepID=UPI00188D3CBA|nr:hypothetical protein [Anoxybacillus caldiproteolyticus]QPA33400.1 hypothetical protein ISX45_18930 [Anoxybacillus caldiproteolyticus]